MIDNDTHDSQVFNYEAGKFEHFKGVETDEKARTMVPVGAGVGLYDLYRRQGFNITDALIKVLRICAGVEEKEPHE